MDLLFFSVFVLLGVAVLCFAALATPGPRSVFTGDYSNLQEMPTIPADIREVQLHHNYISILPPHTFSHLSQCTHLDMSHNDLFLIDSRAFNGLSHLEELLLYNNRISKLPPYLFSPLVQCAKLNLSNNEIVEIKNNTFSGLHNLMFLDLHHNMIAVVEREAFTDLGSLKTLDLHDNVIEHLPSHVFSALAQCTKLSLDFNQISMIEAQTFQGLYKLGELHLTHNQIRTLDSNWFTSLPRPLTLIVSYAKAMGGTPWDCNSLCWLKDEETKGTVTWHASGSQGYQPKCVKGTWDHLQCSPRGKWCCVFVFILCRGNLMKVWGSRSFCPDLCKFCQSQTKKQSEHWKRCCSVPNVRLGKQKTCQLFSSHKRFAFQSSASAKSQEACHMQSGVELCTHTTLEMRFNMTAMSVTREEERYPAWVKDSGQVPCPSVKVCMLGDQSQPFENKVKTDINILFEKGAFHSSANNGLMVPVGILHCWILLLVSQVSENSTQCGQPPPVPHSTLSGVMCSYESHDQVQYSCDGCYTGGGTVTCLPDGSWSGDAACIGT